MIKKKMFIKQIQEPIRNYRDSLKALCTVRTPQTISWSGTVLSTR